MIIAPTNLLPTLCTLSSAYLSCAYVNVASTVNGGRCVNASGSPETCQRALNGSDESLSISNEWYYTGAGVGSWIKIEFAQKYIINTIRVKQRAHIVQQSKGLKLSFMDGSNAYVSVSDVTDCTFKTVFCSVSGFIQPIDNP